MWLSKLRIVKMTLFVAQCFLFISAFLSVYGTFTSWKQTKPTPVTSYKLQPFLHDPIYDENGRVISGDFYRGDLKYIYSGVSHADFAFVYYYAPWDNDSQNFANDFWHLAHKYSKVAYFSAVNCWYNKGECKHAFPRTPKFPKIIGYVRGYHGNTYSGRLLLNDFEEFIQLHLRPVRQISTISDVLHFTSASQAVVAGYYDVKNYKSSMYTKFIDTARKALHVAKEKNLVFLTVASEVAEDLGMEFNDIGLFTWNSTHYFDHNGTYSADDVLQWLRKDFKAVAARLENSISDSEMLYNILESKVAAFIVTPSKSGLNTGMQLKKQKLVKQGILPALEQSCVLEDNITDIGTCLKTSFVAELRTIDILNGVRIQEDLKVVKLLEFTAELRKSELDNEMPYWQHLSYMHSGLDTSSLRFNNQSVFFIFTDYRFPLLDRCGLVINEELVNLIVIDKKNEALYIKEGAKVDDLESLFGNNTFTKGICRTKSYLETQVSDPAVSLDVPDISSVDFDDLVINNKEDVLLFYHSISCGLCIGISHVILSVATMVQLVSKIRVYRIDGAINTLPWQYTVNSYPTLVLFPAHNKADSVVFPYDEPVTVPNIITFLANNISPESRLDLLLLHCNDGSSHCLADARLKLKLKIKQLQSVKNLNTSAFIGGAAKDLRSDNRSAVSKELSYLNLMNFGLWTKISSFAVPV